ncbi:MAG: ATP-binding protein [Bacillota bacterium]
MNMRFPGMRSIRSKLWLAMLALVVIVLGLAALIQAGAMEKIYYGQQERRLLQEGEKLGEAIVGEQDPLVVARQLFLLSRLMNASVMIIDRQGRILHWQDAGMMGMNMGMGHYGMMNRGQGAPGGRGGSPWSTGMSGYDVRVLPDPRLVEKVFQGERVVTRGHNPFFDAEVLVAGVPLQRDGQVAGALFIHAPVAPLAANLKALQQVGLYALFAGALAATVLALLLSRRLTGPLIQMNQVARAMAAGDFGRRCELRSEDELNVLAGSLNTLSEKLQEKIAALERVDRNRREFVANVSHELRTPLTIIQGYAEAVQDGLARREGREDEYLQNILEEVQRLRRLVDDLLDLGRMEAGRVKLKREPVNLALLARRVVDRFTPVAKEKGIVISCVTAEGLPPAAGDADRLEQVLINLVDNAVRYTPAGGEIGVKAEFSPGRVPRRLLVTVRDAGPGIPEDELPLIWERFYKADKARQREGAGSGLGLAIARQIIELHGGTIEVRSRPGEGTSFAFTLPLAGS